MPALILRLTLGGDALRRLFLALLGLNVFLALGTAVFIIAWAQREQYQPLELSFLRYVLVQVHLATENVLAAWYSSMLLLAVALAALIAYTLPRRADIPASPRWLREAWLVVAAVFVVLSFDEIGSMHERIGVAVTFGRPEGWGWVYVLALPIAAIAAYLAAFAWFELRRVPLAFRLFVAGVALFVCNPILEQIEMALIRGEGARADTWQRFAHDVLLVLEEGVLEIFGTMCFLGGILVWVREHAPGPDASLTARVSPEAVARASGIAAIVIAAGVLASAAAVRILPAGDTGIPMNWFPAAAAFLVFVLTLAARQALPYELYGLRRLARALAVLSLAISGYFGAAIYGYADWGAFDALREILRMLLAVGFAIACVMLARTPDGGPIGALFVAAGLMAAAIGVTGPHAAVVAGWASAAAATGVAAALSHVHTLGSYNEPRMAQRSGNAGRPTVV